MSSSPHTLQTPAIVKPLHRLLDLSLELPPEYDDGFTSHLPMALHALDDLGADEARLHAFFDFYVRRFKGASAPVPAPNAARGADWSTLRGQHDAFASLCATFDAALRLDGRDRVLRAALPLLLPGLGTEAFHGVIRTAHAIESGHHGELAHALAYWASRWELLANAPAGEPITVRDWTQALVDQAAGWTSESTMISARMLEAAESAPYRALAGRAVEADKMLPGLSAFAAARYAETRNFTALHMVTGLRALRVVRPWVEDFERWVPTLLGALTAAYLAAGLERGAPAEAVLGWSEVIAAAVASDDDHVVKIVHACRHLAAEDGEQGYLEAANRAVAAA